jgi:hypothetical protein
LANREVLRPPYRRTRSALLIALAAPGTTGALALLWADLSGANTASVPHLWPAATSVILLCCGVWIWARRQDDLSQAIAGLWLIGSAGFARVPLRLAGWPSLSWWPAPALAAAPAAYLAFRWWRSPRRYHRARRAIGMVVAAAVFALAMVALFPGPTTQDVRIIAAVLYLSLSASAVYSALHS